MQRKGRTAFILAFLSPAVLLYGLFVVFPLVQSFQISFFQWKGLSENRKFVGLDNFHNLAHDNVFWQSLKDNLWLLVVVGFLAIALGTGIAHAMGGEGRLSKLLRSVYLFPQAISLVVVATIWMFAFNPSYGLVSSGLRAVGLGRFDHAWLGESSTALPAVAAALLWYIAGFYIMLFSAGMKAIPQEVGEAASLDGAVGMKRFWRVTWPMLWSIRRVAVVYVVINVMNVFALVYLMTQGGPDRKSEVMLTYLYEQAFVNNDFGYATALAIANFVVAMLLSATLMFIYRRNPEAARA